MFKLLLKKVGKGTLILNFIIQRLFRVNGRFKHMLHYTSVIRCPHGFEIIGEYDSVNLYHCLANSNGLYINAKNSIKVHSSVFIASGCKLVSANHDLKDKKKHVECLPIVIGEDVWIGANSVILPGVVLGKGCVVGAGSIVTKNVTPYTVVAGNPAKVLKEI